MLTAKGGTSTVSSASRWAPTIICPSPFNPRELLALVNAVLRRRSARPRRPRSRGGNGWPSARSKSIWRPAPLKRRRRDGGLTTGEFAVLKVLLQHPRQPLSRDKLMTLARGMGNKAPSTAPSTSRFPVCGSWSRPTRPSPLPADGLGFRLRFRPRRRPRGDGAPRPRPRG